MDKFSLVGRPECRWNHPHVAALRGSFFWHRSNLAAPRRLFLRHRVTYFMFGDMSTLRFLFGLTACLIVAGCSKSSTPHSYIGTAEDGDWPYRYTLTQMGERWSGIIEYRDAGGWIFWDAMDGVEYKESRIRFTAKADDSPGFRPGWNLVLNNVSPQGFSGLLTGDVFSGSRFIRLSFVPILTEQSAAANRR